MPSPEAELRDRIRRDGAVTVADYMEAANAHYYATRDPLGRAGDFITAPEISQMFGELVGIWIVDIWQRAGRPAVHYVELGPGRGTLARDARRVLRGAGLDPVFHLVETSPFLRAAQAETLGKATWHQDLSTVPDDRPLIVVANEFFDALPIRQRDGEGRELLVRLDGERFVRDPARRVVEDSPASAAVAARLADRLRCSGGAALIIDYGHDGDAPGDTLQAVSAHRFADPWQAPGSRDLTAWVDFGALRGAAAGPGLRCFGPVGQGRWLTSLGIEIRAAALAKASPQRVTEIAAARDRLIAPGQMGRLFQVMALVSDGWPDPAGLA